jgi:hypothetical protein
MKRKLLAAVNITTTLVLLALIAGPLYVQTLELQGAYFITMALTSFGFAFLLLIHLSPVRSRTTICNRLLSEVLFGLVVINLVDELFFEPTKTEPWEYACYAVILHYMLFRFLYLYAFSPRQKHQ